MPEFDHYKVLGVDRNATVEQIRAAWRAACFQHHPDKGGDPEFMKLVNLAWEVLGDEVRRRVYDDSFRGEKFGEDSPETADAADAQRSPQQTRTRAEKEDPVTFHHPHWHQLIWNNHL